MNKQESTSLEELDSLIHRNYDAYCAELANVQREYERAKAARDHLIQRVAKLALALPSASPSPLLADAPVESAPDSFLVAPAPTPNAKDEAAQKAAEGHRLLWDDVQDILSDRARSVRSARIVAALIAKGYPDTAATRKKVHKFTVRWAKSGRLIRTGQGLFRLPGENDPASEQSPIDVEPKETPVAKTPRRAKPPKETPAVEARKTPEPEPAPAAKPARKPRKAKPEAEEAETRPDNKADPAPAAKPARKPRKAKPKAEEAETKPDKKAEPAPAAKPARKPRKAKPEAEEAEARPDKKAEEKPEKTKKPRFLDALGDLVQQAELLMVVDSPDTLSWEDVEQVMRGAGPLTVREILDAIEAKDSTKTTSMRAFSARLRGWTRSGELENVDRGLYQLVRKKK